MTKNELDIADLLDRIGQVVGDAARPVPLHEPRFDGAERDYVLETIDTGWVSSVGRFVNRFESDLAEICQVPYVVATGTGTAALHVALLLAGVQPGEEVLLPSLTFIATANAVKYCDAIPHFCDSEMDSFGIDPGKLDAYLRDIVVLRNGVSFNKVTGNRIAALVPVHIFGHPAKIDELAELSTRWSIPLVEDSTEALGSKLNGRPVGHHGLLSTLSFNGNKIVTTGGGGAILTADPDLAKRAKHLTTTAKVPHAWRFDHDAVGYNYRLTNISAALGVAQLERLPVFVDAKRRLAERYMTTFDGFAGGRILREPSGAESNYWLNTLILDEGCEGLQEDVLQAANDAGFMVRPLWTPMHRLPMFKGAPAMDLSVCESLSARVVNLPSSPGLELSRAG